MAKKDNTMSNEATPAVELPTIKEQKIPQKLSVTDLSTGEDGATVVNNYVKYTAPSYDKKYGTREQFTAALLQAATALVQPVDNQIDALLYRATQDSYQAGKVAAFASGNYLSPELKSKVTELVMAGPKYAGAKSSEAFAAWKAAFTSVGEYDGAKFTTEQVGKRKASADKVLKLAQDILNTGADEDSF